MTTTRSTASTPSPAAGSGRTDRGGPGERFDSWGLVAAAQAGDRDAFGKLYARYQPQILRQMRRGTRDSGLAEDLTSETFLQAWRSLAGLHDRGDGNDLGLWLSVVAANRLRHHYNTKRARTERVSDEVSELAERHPVDGPVQGPEDALLAQEKQRVAAETVGRLLDGLPPTQRQVIELAELGPERMRMAQVSQILGGAERSTRAVRDRALAAMRRQLTADAGTGTGSRQAGKPDRDRAESDGRARVAGALAGARSAVARLRPLDSSTVEGARRPGDEFARLTAAARAWQHHHDQHTSQRGDQVAEQVSDQVRGAGTGDYAQVVA